MRIHRITALLTVFVLAAAACFSTWFVSARSTAGLDPEAKMTPREAVRIAVIIRTGSEFWESVAAGIAEVADTYGAEVTFFYTAGRKHVLAFDEALLVAVRSGVDVIIAPYRKEPSFDEALLAARQAGCKIVFIDNDGDPSLRDCYIGIDHYLAGYVMGERMRALSAPGDHFLICVSSQNLYNQNTTMIHAGIADALAETGCEARLITVDNDTDVESPPGFSDLIAEDPDITGVFLLSQKLTRGFAMLNSGEIWPRKLTLIGLDYQDVMLPYIQSGELTVLSKDSLNLGRESARQACILALTGAAEADSIDCGFLLIDASAVGGDLRGELP